LNYLLIQPPAYDFSCHDFWLKPLGLLKLATLLTGNGHEVHFFDFLDRSAPDVSEAFRQSRPDGRGKFPSRIVSKPAQFNNVPRYFRRYGRSEKVFESWLRSIPEPSHILLTCGLSYWAPGIEEVVSTLRQVLGDVPITVGGILPSLFPAYVSDLGIEGVSMEKLPGWLKERGLAMEALMDAAPFWSGYGALPYLVTRLSYGCPFHCSYCAVPHLQPGIHRINPQRMAEEIFPSLRPETKHIVFYDDALLFHVDSLIEFGKILSISHSLSYHTPNGLACRLVDPSLAVTLKNLNFKTLMLSLETIDPHVQSETGGKVSMDDCTHAISHLREAGFSSRSIQVYLLMGHPSIPPDKVRRALDAIGKIGVIPILAEYSPIPGTIDGDRILGPNPMDPMKTNKTYHLHTWADSTTIQELKDIQLAYSRSVMQ